MEVKKRDNVDPPFSFFKCSISKLYACKILGMQLVELYTKAGQIQVEALFSLKNQDALRGKKQHSKYEGPLQFCV